MRHVAVSWACLAALSVALPGCSGCSGDSPYAGTWKVTVAAPGEDVTLFLLDVADRAGAPEVKVLSYGADELEDAKVTAARGDSGELRLTVRGQGLTLTVVGYPPEGEARPEAMLGFAEKPGQRDFVRWERSKLKTLDGEKTQVPRRGARELLSARRLNDARDREARLRALADSNDDEVLRHYARLELIETLAAVRAAEADLRRRAEDVVGYAARHGPEMRGLALTQLARRLVAAGTTPALAVEYARAAEKAVGETAPAGERVRVLKTLAAALRQAGDADLAEVEARLTALEEELDKVYLAGAIPFKPEPYHSPRESGRTVLVELFTGAQCPPCIAADVAFDALRQTYQPQDVVLLQYHLHVPGPDPLTNADAEARSEYYRVPGTPSYFVNGGEGPAAGGYKEMAKEVYDELRKAVRAALEVEPRAKLALTARRDGDAVTLRAEVSGLKKTGEGVRLRLALVEEVVRYTGRNEQRLHHHVVRVMPGGAGGLPLAEGAAVHEMTANLAELRRSLNDYLAGRGFPEGDRPLNLTRLKAVGFIQDDATREVLQAAQADIAEVK